MNPIGILTGITTLLGLDNPDNRIQLLIVFVQAVTAVLIYRYVRDTNTIANASRQTTLNETKPHVRGLVSVYSTKSDIGLDFMNDSRTDAIGLVTLFVFIDDVQKSFDNRAYEGKDVWSFPGRLKQGGHINLLHCMPGMTAEQLGAAHISIIIFIHYRVASSEDIAGDIDKRYHAPVQKYEYYDNRWIPILTTRGEWFNYEPDWALLENKREASGSRTLRT